MTTTKRNKKTYFVKLSTTTYHRFSGYADIYDALKADLDVLDSAPETAIIVSGPLSGSSRVARLVVKYQDGGTAEEPIIKTGRVICGMAKIEEALQGLRAKKYKAKDIKDVQFARRRILI